MFCLLASPLSATDRLHLVTEAYPPFNYEEGGTLKGVAVDLLKAVMQDAGIDYDMRLQPWARAYGLAVNTPGYCVFSTVHNQERDRLFEWVEPLFTSESYLVRTQSSHVTATSLDEAKSYLVGTQLGDYTVDVLKAHGFTRLDLASEIDLTVKKLLAGRIDLMPMAAPMIIDMKKRGIVVEPVAVLVSNVNGLACNKNVDPDLLARMRASLNRMIADGTRTAIFERYSFAEGGLNR